MKPKNIMVNIVSDLTNHVFTSQNNICKCEECKNNIIAYVLSRIPAQYVTTETGAISILIEYEMGTKTTEIIKQILKAIELIKINNPHKSAIGSKDDKDKAFALLLENMEQSRGVDFKRYIDKLLKSRINQRMRVNKVETYSDYLRTLLSNPKEYDKLFNQLTINVTEFFRDTEVFKLLNNILTEVIAAKTQKGENSIKIWSAGCASGEESYSIALLANEIIKKQNIEFNIIVIATDISKKCLTIAKFGEYGLESLKNINAINKELLTKYFIYSNSNEKYKIKDEIKKLVQFQYHNLISDSPFEDIDIIFCRNVLMFFNRSLQEHLVMTFYRSLKKGSYLTLGEAETFLRKDHNFFKEINPELKIYQKI